MSIYMTNLIQFDQNRVGTFTYDDICNRRFPRVWSTADRY